MGLGNFFEYICPSCGGLYQDIIENGRSMLLHKGLTSSKDKTALPTNKCVPYHKYVVFQPCGHCCPEVFDECRPCKRGFPGASNSPGYPTNIECRCHYCQTETKDQKTPEPPVQHLVYNINSDGGSVILGSANVSGNLIGRDQNVHQTSSNPITQHILSEVENELLIAAVDHGEFHIVSVQQVSGSWVKVRGRDFLNENDPSFAAKYLEAFQSLQRYGYIIHQNGDLYMLTGSGFECARRLKSVVTVE